MNQAHTLLRPTLILGTEPSSAPTAVANIGRPPGPALFTGHASILMSWRSSRSQESNGYEMPNACDHASPGSNASQTTTCPITRSPHLKKISIEYLTCPFRLSHGRTLLIRMRLICNTCTLQGSFWLCGRSSAPQPFYPSTFWFLLFFCTFLGAHGLIFLLLRTLGMFIRQSTATPVSASRRDALV